MKKEGAIVNLGDLFSKADRNTRLVNLLSLYRIFTAPVLLVMLYTGNDIIFKWMLLVSFSTDMLDGFFARRLKVTTILGAKLDSIGDGLTLLVAILGLIELRIDFIVEQVVIISGLISLFLVQLIFSFIRYRKISSFHTYTAKASALFVGVFMLSLFFFDEPVYLLFYIAAATTTLELIEEIILVALLPEWVNDVKGLYWVLKEKRSKKE